MNTAKTSKSARAITPTAQPAASQSAGKDQGADTADMPTIDDIASAIGDLADSPETDETTEDKSADETETGAADDESDDPETEAAIEDATEAEAGKSETEEGESDEPTEEPGESTEEETDEASAKGEDAPADEGKGKTPEWAQKRFDELTAARHSAEEAATELREQNAVLRAAAAGALAARPLDFVDTPEQLLAEKRKLLADHKWALTHEDGGKLGDRELTREEVAALRADTYGLLQEDVPARERWLEAKVKADALAVQSYPWLKDTKAGDGATVQSVVENFPQLRALPNYRLALANMVLAEKFRAAGLPLDDALLKRLSEEKTRRDRAAGTAKPGASAAKPLLRKPPIAPGRPGTLPSRATPRVAQQRAAEKRMSASHGSEDDIANLIAAEL